MKPLALLLVFVATLTVEAQKPVSDTPPRVYNVENTAPDTPRLTMLPADQLPIINELPDPLEGVKDFGEMWKRHGSA